MQLGLKIAHKQIQTLKPTMQQLQYYRLLQQTNLELELDIREEIAQNPALEVEETTKCPNCGEILLDGQPCMTCITRRVEDDDRAPIQSEKLDMMEEIYSSTQGQYEASTYESLPDDEVPDTFASVVRSISLEDHLKQIITTDFIDLSEEDILLAEEIIDRIDTGAFDEVDTELEELSIDKAAVKRTRVDNPGFIRASDAVLAGELNVPVERLSAIRRLIASIDPVGSGLQNSIEVLALQAELDERIPDDERSKLAEIIRKYLKDIARDHHARVGKKVGLSAKRIRDLIDHMRKNYHIHPRRKFEESEPNADTENPHISADVRIRDVDGALVVEVIDSGLPQLRINKFYMESYQKLKKDRNAFNSEERKHIREYFERASTYIENLNSRRATMLEITEEIVKRQEGFLRHGPLYLKKLTRKEIAEAIKVHPSTVSRALAVRYCWLPDNSIVPFHVFFNPSACYIEMIRQILRGETVEKVYSDEEIRDIMVEKGHNLSRRVITKYRKKGHIPPSGRRRRNLIKEARENDEELAARLEAEYGDEMDEIEDDELDDVEDIEEENDEVDDDGEREIPVDKLEDLLERPTSPL